METIISLRGVTKEYMMGKTIVKALRGVDLDIEKGAFYSIVGPSGSGKSSLLHLMGCMDVPTQGTLRIGGVDINGLKEKDMTGIRAEKLGFVFQSFYLNPILTALENVAMALRLMGEPKKTAVERAKNWLAKVGLSDRLHHFPSELSGGERQRVAIARALVKNPAIVLADEPTGNLDSRRGREIVELLRTIVNEQKTTIIMVTHDQEIARIGDAIITLRDGMIEAA
jgi:putative ABC transport system ATP-binding protein